MKTIFIFLVLFSTITTFSQDITKVIYTDENVSSSLTLSISGDKLMFRSNIKNTGKETILIRIPSVSYNFRSPDSLRKTLFYNMSDSILIRDERHGHELFFEIIRLAKDSEIVFIDTFSRFYTLNSNSGHDTIVFEKVVVAFSYTEESKLLAKKDYFFNGDRKGQYRKYRKIAPNVVLKPKLVNVNAFRKYNSPIKLHQLWLN